MHRRTVVAGLGIGGFAALSGCLGVIGMNGHESTPAGVAPGVREDAGYEQPTVDDLVVEEDVGIDAYSETITVTNHLTEYEKGVDMGPLGEQRGAVFTVLSTPQVELAGRQFNPVEDMAAAELVTLIEGNYDGVETVSLEEESAVMIFDQSTTRSRFSADAEFEGRSVEVDLHVTEAVEAGDDLVVTIGVYPRELRAREEGHVLSLMEGVTETLEEDASATGDDGADSDGAEDGSENADGDGSGADNETRDGNESSGDDGSADDSADNDSDGDSDDGGFFDG